MPRGGPVGWTIPYACLPQLGLQTTAIVSSSFVIPDQGTNMFRDSLLPLAPQSGNAVSHNFMVGNSLCCLIRTHSHLEPETENKITVCSFNFFCSVPFDWRCLLLLCGRVIFSHPCSYRSHAHFPSHRPFFSSSLFPPPPPSPLFSGSSGTPWDG